MATIVNPIWKDTYYTANTNSCTYSIQLDGNVIYSGRAVRYPNANTLQININKIAKNYLSSDIDEILRTHATSITSQVNALAERTFNLYIEGIFVQDYKFYMDWSYDWEAPTSELSQPINGHYAPGMYKLHTTRTSNITTYANTGNYPTQVKCCKYALYYLNSYGGWDALAIEGNNTKTDTYTAYQTDKVFNNTTIEFETNKYINEIKTKYVLNTNYLNDEQSSNLAKNLLGSLKVYLHDLENDIIKPVLITDSSVAYQTYQGNNRKMAQYKINVVESQSKIRN